MSEDRDRTERHVPVLAEQAIEQLVWNRDGTYVDATLGDGGHAESILKRLSENGRLIALDRDPDAHIRAAKYLQQWSGQLTQREAPFSSLNEVLNDLNIAFVDGVLFDLGVSSPQIDRAERGFSFRYDGPLDMRMGPDAEITAADALNHWSREEIARVLREYGEEPRAARIADAIVRARPLKSTEELVTLVGRGGKERPEKSLARVFQAIRIAVNRELDELRLGLAAALSRLHERGRIVVISYHSLEDRIVKQWMRRESSDCICPPGLPVCACGHVAKLRRVTKGAVKASAAEIASNSRARSARMRIAERVPEAA